jgi:hypothetical protein
MTTTQTNPGPSPIHGNSALRVAAFAGASTREPAPVDVAAAIVQMALGAALAAWGVAWLLPMLSIAVDSQHAVGVHAVWFDYAMALMLVTSGMILATSKAAALALTMLIPVGMHLLFQWVAFGP